MTVQDVEDVIRDFKEEWKKALEDAAAGNIPIETTPINPLDKGKYKVGSKRKEIVEVPPPAQRRKMQKRGHQRHQRRKNSKPQIQPQRPP